MNRPPYPDIDNCIHLRDLGGTRPIPEWAVITWAECPVCGASGPYTTADADEAVFDGEPVVCPDCGCVGATSVDVDGASVVWREEEALTDAALAGFWRLVGLLKVTHDPR